MDFDPVVILLVDGGPLADHAHVGRFVTHYDPAGRTPDEVLRTTDDPMQAKEFVRSTEAFQFWQQRNGTRPDGEPNRPLTAYTVEIARRSRMVGS